MIFKDIATGVPVKDSEFHQLFPLPLREVADTHFTPVEIAKMAARYLVTEPGTRVLDIGSGAGKFCMVGAACTDGHFTGVEQREGLYTLSKKLLERYHLSGVEFIHANITEMDLRWFEAFYLFNPFYENIHRSECIDTTIELNRKLYFSYSNHVKEQLDALSKGTKLVTYFSYLDEIPDSFEPQIIGMDGKLKFWEKKV